MELRQAIKYLQSTARSKFMAEEDYNGVSAVDAIVAVYVTGKEYQSDELIPCPFCGNQAELFTQKHIPNGTDYTPRCSIPSCPGRITKRWSDKRTAISKWNTRSVFKG